MSGNDVCSMYTIFTKIQNDLEFEWCQELYLSCSELKKHTWRLLQIMLREIYLFFHFIYFIIKIIALRGRQICFHRIVD